MQTGRLLSLGPSGGGPGLPTGVWRLRATPPDRGLCRLHRSLTGDSGLVRDVCEGDGEAGVMLGLLMTLQLTALGQ